MSKIRVRNWLMLADKNLTAAKINNGNETIDENLEENLILTNNGPSIMNTTTNSPAELENATLTIDDDGDNQIVIKIERDSPSPPPSLLLNNLSDFSYDDDEEDSDDEEFDGSVPSEDFNYDIKISSPISWANQTIKMENIDTDYELPIIGIANLPLTMTPPLLQSSTSSTSTPTPETTAASFLSAASTTIKKSTTTLVPAAATLSTNKQQQNNNNNKSLAQLAEIRKVYGPASGINTRTRRASMLLATAKEEQFLNKPETMNTSSGSTTSTGIRLIHKLHNKTLGKLTEISSPDQFKTTTVATAIGNDDKKYRILFQNQRMRKESLEHSSDMIYKGTDTDKPWICKNCNRSYKWKNSLKCHLKNECGQPPRYFCSKMCGYRTNVHSNLKRHMNTKCKNDDNPATNSSNEDVVVPCKGEEQTTPDVLIDKSNE